MEDFTCTPPDGSSPGQTSDNNVGAAIRAAILRSDNVEAEVFPFGDGSWFKGDAPQFSPRSGKPTEKYCIGVDGCIPGTQTPSITDGERAERFEHYKALSTSLGLGLPLKWGDWSSGQPPVLQRVRRPEGGWIEVEPHFWGLKLKQCREMMQAVRSDENHTWNPDYNMDQLVKFYIGPWTAGTGMGYALLANHDEPLEINVMVQQSNARHICITL